MASKSELSVWSLQSSCYPKKG